MDEEKIKASLGEFKALIGEQDARVQIDCASDPDWVVVRGNEAGYLRLGIALAEAAYVDRDHGGYDWSAIAFRLPSFVQVPGSIQFLRVDDMPEYQRKQRPRRWARVVFGTAIGALAILGVVYLIEKVL